MGVAVVDAPTVARMLGDGEPFVLLDCREHDEVRLAAIPGAIHIPLGEIPTRLVSLDPDASTVVFCHRGVRSQKVAVWLGQQGFTDVRSMRGGIDAWAVEVDPSVPRY